MGGLNAVLGSRALRICLAYGLISMTISMAYKGILSGFRYDSKFIMLSQQLGASLAFVAIAQRFLAGVPGFEVPAFSWETLRRSLLSGVLFVCNIVVGWYGLQLVNMCVRAARPVAARRRAWRARAARRGPAPSPAQPHPPPAPHPHPHLPPAARYFCASGARAPPSRC